VLGAHTNETIDVSTSKASYRCKWFIRLYKFSHVLHERGKQKSILIVRVFVFCVRFVIPVFDIGKTGLFDASNKQNVKFFCVVFSVIMQ
jgi:hypothetical protein